MKRYFLLKKKKFIQEGNKKFLSEIELILEDKLYSNFINNKEKWNSKINNENNIIFIGAYKNKKSCGFGIYKNSEGTTFKGI